MKVVMSIAGSDCSGGAGIQADLKTFEAFGVFGTTAITVLTAQNTTGVKSINPVPSDFIKRQIETIMDDFEIEAIKIGMLFDIEIIDVVTKIIESVKIPVVLDPVCISKAGSPLLCDNAIEKLKELSYISTVTTPNNYEALALFGYSYKDSDSFKSLLDHPSAILVKNITNNLKSTDLLYKDKNIQSFSSDYIETKNLHGTGCSYSAAIAANLALSHTLEESIKTSKLFISEALRYAPKIGAGPGPINHKIAGRAVDNMPL